MFIKGEDYYFITYNMIILLNELGCWASKGRKLQEVRKISYLIDFVANEQLCSILEKYKDKDDINRFDKQLLRDSYSNGMLREEGMNRLLYSLEKRGFIELSKNDTRQAYDVTLVDSPDIKEFIKSEIFEVERENATSLRKSIKFLTRLTLESMLIKLFDNYGVTTWPV